MKKYPVEKLTLDETRDMVLSHTRVQSEDLIGSFHLNILLYTPPEADQYYQQGVQPNYIYIPNMVYNNFGEAAIMCYCDDLQEPFSLAMWNHVL